MVVCEEKRQVAKDFLFNLLYSTLINERGYTEDSLNWFVISPQAETYLVNI